MRVLKFGGTSVGSAESIEKVARIIMDTATEQDVAVVVSAVSGITNLLVDAGNTAATGDEAYKAVFTQIEEKHIQLVNALFPAKLRSNHFAHIKILLNDLDDLLHGVFLLRELSLKTMDLIFSFGERLSAYLIASYLTYLGQDAAYVDARELIRTDNQYGMGRVDYTITYAQIRAFFKKRDVIPVITGFIASTAKGETTTLGRGGSDFTASLIAAGARARAIEIWTDVNGVMTADPRQIKSAFSLSAVTYEEAMEMSHFGAKVIYPPTIQPAFSKNIPIYIKNTFNPAFEGTLIGKKGASEKHLIKCVSSIPDIALVNVQGSGMVGVPGIASRMFGALARKDINIILITQASSEYSICFAIKPEDAAAARAVLEEEFAWEIERNRITQISIERGLSVLAIIGENMRHTRGITANLFGTLGHNGVNVVAIAQGSSELNISVVIEKSDLSKAVSSLHESFFLSDIQNLHVFIVGVGLIGGTLVDQIRSQHAYLLKQYSINIKVIGLSNSRKMLFNEDGIPLDHYQEILMEKGEKASLKNFVGQIKDLNLPNSIFVDCTSSEEVVSFYADILKNSISIVTPNKLANSNLYFEYHHLQQMAKKYGVSFLYETNVGAGLPIINTLKGLTLTGDKVFKIEGILSGTISYIFNNFTSERTFSSVVREAKEKGLTEPDPRDDLNGMDVARKILILARDAGFNLEPDDINVENILPPACLSAPDIDGFFDELGKADPEFEKRRAEAEKNNKKLRFIALLDNGEATVSLQEVGPDHPFYAVSGADNIVSFTTARYSKQPLVVKGPGAGADVTAAGVFSDIISIANKSSIYGF